MFNLYCIAYINKCALYIVYILYILYIRISYIIYIICVLFICILHIMYIIHIMSMVFLSVFPAAVAVTIFSALSDLIPNLISDLFLFLGLFPGRSLSGWDGIFSTPSLGSALCSAELHVQQCTVIESRDHAKEQEYASNLTINKSWSQHF